MFDSFVVCTKNNNCSFIFKVHLRTKLTFFNRLQNKPNTFEVKVSDEADFKLEEINEECKNINPNKFTEIFLIMGSCSPFKTLVQRYQTISIKYIVQDGKESDLNKYYCDALPIFPFCFRILKHMYLNDRSQHRLDEFSASLRTHGSSTQCLLWIVLNTKKKNRRTGKR